MSRVFDALGPDGFGVYEVDFTAEQPTFRRVHQKPGGLLCPGFVDIHIHGAGGIDFMSADTENLVLLCNHLRRCGYEGFLPTTVTASPADVLAALARLPEDPLILGFHLEGPFISTKYPGAQPQHAIVNPPDGPSEWDPILDDPRLRVITMAPELPHALELVLRLSSRGVKVSMGHTNATFEEARRGFEFGASHSTHTFNAMRPLHHREAGTVGYCLSNPSIYSEIIYDRLHVCKDAAGILIQAKPDDHLIGISDCTMAQGLPPGTRLTMWNLDCTTGQGDVRLTGTDTLAGSAATLLDVFCNLWEDFSPELAIRACTLNPRAAIRLERPPTTYLEFTPDRKLEARWYQDATGSWSRFNIVPD